MNKTLVVIIVACLLFGLALIIASKINPTTLFVIGIISIVIAILLTAFVLYNAYKKN